LLTGNTSTGDTWKCKTIPNDGLENGTAQISGTVSVNTGLVAPYVINTTPITQGQGISNSTHPTNRAEQINFSIEYNDSNTNNVWTAYICNTSTITTSGCADKTWAKSPNNQSLQSLTLLISNITNLSLQTHDYFVGIVDNTSQISQILASTFVVGDDLFPAYSNFQVDALSKTTGTTGSFYVDCDDETYGSGVSHGKIWLFSYFDNGATYNANLTASLDSGNTYKATKSYTDAGIWGYRAAYCVDNKGNTNGTKATINITVSAPSSPSTPPAVAGGGSAAGGDVELKFGYANILKKTDTGVLTYNETAYSVTVGTINTDTNIVYMSFRDQTLMMNKGEDKKVDLTGNGQKDITVKITDLDDSQVAFYLNMFGDAVGSDCVEHIWIHEGKIEECDYACDHAMGCYFKHAGEEASIARECGTKLLMNSECVSESPFAYILSKDFFVLEGVMEVADLEQTLLGIRDTTKGIPVEQKINVTNIGSDPIYAKFEGEYIDEVLLQKIEPSETQEFLLNIYPLRGRNKGFIEAVIQQDTETIQHSIIYQMKIVTCKSLGSKVQTSNECCSKVSNSDNVCVPLGEGFSIFWTYLAVGLFMLVIVSIIYTNKKIKKKGKPRHFWELPD